MEKFYRMLDWLSIEQALDWIKILTGTPLLERDLLALRDEGYCDSYLDCVGVIGTSASAGNSLDLIDVTGKGFGCVAELSLLGENDSVSVHGEVWEIDDNEVFWSAFIPLELRHLKFKPAEIKALAAKMNEEATDASELEALRQHRDSGLVLMARVKEHLNKPEDEPKPSHLLTIAALLELLKEPVENPRLSGLNQDGIKGEILTKFKWRGLSKRNLESIFAAANKAKKAAE
jgi:hypothetical protein